MKLFYKNTINLNFPPNPDEQRRNISKEIIRHSDYMPNTLKYEDIDRSFKEWVDEKIKIIQDGELLPTMVLYSNQRFSEYLQTWQYTDENNNIRLNFKTITRENNPRHGSILGETYNIPGDRFYTFKSLQAIDESGKEYRIDYKMRQPTPVDLIYKISIFTNRYTTINEFNEIVNVIFNSKHDFISPNGHYMSIVLENIGDESEYNINDRQFFSQNITIKVRGYIIKENDFKVEENPVASIIYINDNTGKRKQPTIELSEYDPCIEDNGEYYKKYIDIDIDFTYCWPHKGKTKFTIDECFTLTGIQFKDDNNIVKDTIKLYINDELISENLLKDAFEGYVLINELPDDSNIHNTGFYKELPSDKQSVYKYIIYNNEYYKWHSIDFFEGDEITIQTERMKKKETSGMVTLNGYNRFAI